MPYNPNIPGFMRENELIVVSELAKRVKKDRIIVELGTFFGRSAVALAASAPSSPVYCIDTWDASRDHNTKLWNHAGLNGDVSMFDGSIESTFRKVAEDFPNIRPLKGLSTADWRIEKAELIFVDAAHDYEGVRNDLKVWAEKLAKGGLLCGHDFCGQFKGVMAAVHEFAFYYKRHVFSPAGTHIWMLFNDRSHMAKWCPIPERSPAVIPYEPDRLA